MKVSPLGNSLSLLGLLVVAASAAGQEETGCRVAPRPIADLDPRLELDFDPAATANLLRFESWSGAAPDPIASKREPSLFEAEPPPVHNVDSISLGLFQDTTDESYARPDAEGTAGGIHANLAETATNPVAPLMQFQIQNNFVGESNAGSGYSNEFILQGVLPWKIGELSVLSRLTLPLVLTPDLGDPIGREFGLGDFVALNAFVFTIDDGPWKGMWAPIVTATLPTATSDFTGSGKWQVGPGFGYINTATEKLQWGAFGYQQWSFASSGGDGDRAEVSKLYFQPVLTRHFEGGWYAGLGDLLWSYDWNNEVWSIPLSARVGRVTKIGNQSVNIFVQPFYDVSSNNPGDEWGVKLNLTLLFPTR